MDALTGRTVLEYKSDLRREAQAAREQLQRYLDDLESETDDRYVGIATDGAAFEAYRLEDGDLVALGSFSPATEDPDALLRWLDTSLAVRPDLEPDPERVHAALGKDSLA